MDFFPIGRKLDLSKDYYLQEIPIFAGLTSSERRMIEKKARLVEYKRGDRVYEEGAEADAFYVIISGRFRLFVRSRDDRSEETLTFFYRGDHFGETSILLGHPHSATVEAKSDGLVLKLEKEDFLKLTRDIPAVALYLSRSLGHRLTKRDETSEKEHREVKIAALYSGSDRPEVFQFWIDFAGSLTHQTYRYVVMVDLAAPVPPVLSPKLGEGGLRLYDLNQMDPSNVSDLKSYEFEHALGFHYLPVSGTEVTDVAERKVASLLTVLSCRYDYLLLRLPRQMTPLVFKTLKHSDMVYFFTEPGASDLTECGRMVEEFSKTFGFSLGEVKVLVPEENNPVAIPFEDKERLLGHTIFSLVPDDNVSRERYLATIKFLSKEFSGTLVGLALGSGAAYGLAHIGVIRMLERENIPIDIISGSSMGALVAALWAAGFNADELEKIARQIDMRTGFFKILGFQDIAMIHEGFFKGDQIARFLAPYLGGKNFQDLRVPVAMTAADLWTGEEIVLRAGNIMNAVRASISIPGIFRPFKIKNRHYIDGGVIDPLPIRVLANRGVKKIIAVNVLPYPSDWSEQYRLHEESLRRDWERTLEKKMWRRLVIKAGRRMNRDYDPNIFNVIMNTILFMESELAQVWSNEADVLIHPLPRDGKWFQFYYCDKFIKAGEEAASEHLAEIKSLLAEGP